MNSIDFSARVSQLIKLKSEIDKLTDDIGLLEEKLSLLSSEYNQIIKSFSDFNLVRGNFFVSDQFGNVYFICTDPNSSDPLTVSFLVPFNFDRAVFDDSLRGS